MKNQIALAAAALAAACVGGPPMGGPGGRMQQSVVLAGDALLWVSFDADRDYRTTRAEAEAGIAREWENAGGGAAIPPLQFQAWAQRAMGGTDLPPFRYEFDADVNNRVTREEFARALLGRFDERDADHDGAITRADLIDETQVMRGSRDRGAAPARPPG